MPTFKIKYDNKLSKGLSNAFGFVALIISLATFVTGKADIVSFFQNVSVLSLTFTLGKTIVAYASGVLAVMFFFGGVVDLILWPFGLNFPIVHFVFGFFVDKVILTWWWQDSSREDIFLAAVLLFLVMTIRIETKSKIVSFVYERHGSKLNAVQIGVICRRPASVEGISIGLVSIRDKQRTIP